MNLITRILCATTLVALPVSLVAQDKGGKPAAEHKQDPKQDKKPETFSVVKTGDTVKCVSTTEAETMKKENQAKFDKEMDAWKAAKKAAEDKKEKFEKPEPKAAAFAVVKDGFKTMDEGNAFIAAEKEKAAKDKAKEGHKDEKKKDDEKKGK